MYTKTAVGNLGREEWLQLRKTGIGGSDAGAVCGLDPYSSPMKVYQDKVCGVRQEQDSEPIRQGHDLENYVARRFMEETGLKVRRSNYMYCSRENPFMIADVDRLVMGEDAGLECKTASAYNADKWKDGEIPLHYILQCVHYMAVTGKRTWYLAVVILGQGFQYHKLVWDNELVDRLTRTERDFWENHVMSGNMPDPDGSEPCSEVLERFFHTAKRDSAIELVGFDEKLARREEILLQMAELEKEQRRIEQEVKLYMKDNERAFSGKYRVSWGNVETARLDAKRIRQEMPEVYRDYAKTSTSRRFQVKAA